MLLNVFILCHQCQKKYTHIYVCAIWSFANQYITMSQIITCDILIGPLITPKGPEKLEIIYL